MQSLESLLYNVIYLTDAVVCQLSYSVAIKFIHSVLHYHKL